MIDDDMPGIIKDVIEDLVDEVWPDLEEELVYFISLKMNEPVIPPPSVNDWCSPCFIFWPWKALRAWYLYSTMPCIYFCSNQLSTK